MGLACCGIFFHGQGHLEITWELFASLYGNFRRISLVEFGDGDFRSNFGNFEVKIELSGYQNVKLACRGIFFRGQGHLEVTLEPFASLYGDFGRIPLVEFGDSDFLLKIKNFMVKIVLGKSDSGHLDSSFIFFPATTMLGAHF